MKRIAADEIATRIELRGLVDEYAWRADQYDYEGWGNLFTADAELIIEDPDGGEPILRAKGIEVLRTALHANDQFVKTFHAVENHRVSLEGAAPMGVTYCTAHHLLKGGGDQPEALVMLVRYHDTYALESNEWRFAERRLDIRWVEFIRSDNNPATILALYQ
jgi:sugar phosphate isomerase/epimerase